MPEEANSPPLGVRVEYEDRASERAAEQIVSTVRRCGVPPM